MAKLVRRFVTGHDAAGRSCFVVEGAAPDVFQNPELPAMVVTDLWVTEDTPAHNRGNVDMAPAGRPVVLHPPASGTIFRMVDFPPDSEYDKVDMTKLMGTNFRSGCSAHRGPSFLVS